jgi:arabinoxylan arabinofuranohydrolase
MTSLDGSFIKIVAPYHFEANELNVIGGKYVYTYCTNWSNRSETTGDWEAYKAEKGISGSAPNACLMCYLVSDNPTDPNSWVYKGMYGPHPGNGTNNNHSHLQKFQGNYYYIFHNAVLKETKKKAGAIDGSAGIYRSICVNKVSVNESTATISEAPTSLAGPIQIKNVNPYELQQMETMATCGGIEYEDITNIKKNTKISTLGNDASENMQVKMEVGSWINVRKVDFGTTGADKIILRAKGTGKIDIRTNFNPKNAIATIEFSSTDFEDHTIEIPEDKLARFKGVKSLLYFIVTEAENVYVDSWQFHEIGTSDIQTIENSKPVQRKIYDLSGRSLSEGQNHRGIVIEQYTDENGVKHSRKVLSD